MQVHSAGPYLGRTLWETTVLILILAGFRLTKVAVQVCPAGPYLGQTIVVEVMTSVAGLHMPNQLVPSRKLQRGLQIPYQHPHP